MRYLFYYADGTDPLSINSNDDYLTDFLNLLNEIDILEETINNKKSEIILSISDSDRLLKKLEKIIKPKLPKKLEVYIPQVHSYFKGNYYYIDKFDNSYRKTRLHMKVYNRVFSFVKKDLEYVIKIIDGQ